TYIHRQLDFLRAEGFLPAAFEARYARAAETIAASAERELPRLEASRVHGDLHLGNVLLRDGVLRVLDFDDACTGPAVQDLWLALPGRDAETRRRRGLFLEGYERFRVFDRGSLRVIKVLRGLRLVRYCGWLAKRWHDPAFKRGWPHFGSADYWRQETEDLEQQVARVAEGLRSAGGEAAEAASWPVGAGGAEAPGELTNKDYFWDWEED
ncbi:MAG: phosphotransferase, partial [Acidobacteriota bacterium]